MGLDTKRLNSLAARAVTEPKGDWVIEILHTDTQITGRIDDRPTWVPMDQYSFTFDTAVDVIAMILDSRVPSDKVRIRNVVTQEALLVGCIL